MHATTLIAVCRTVKGLETKDWKQQCGEIGNKHAVLMSLYLLLCQGGLMMLASAQLQQDFGADLGPQR